MARQPLAAVKLSSIESSAQGLDHSPGLHPGAISLSPTGQAKAGEPVRICALASTHAITSDRLYKTVFGVGL